MKAGFFWHYATRSLVRGRQRTVLAIFCITVGVMSLISLQLVSASINEALTGNIVDVNGGDINVYAPFTPLLPRDLAYFDRLQQTGLISEYATANSLGATITPPTGTMVSFELLAVSRNFPIAGQPNFLVPARTLRVQVLVTGNHVIVGSVIFEQLHAHLGQMVLIRSRGDGRVIEGVIAAEFQDGGGFRGTQVVLSRETLNAIPRPDGQSTPLTYSTAYFTVPPSHLVEVKQLLTERYPVAQVTTAQDTLVLRQNEVNNIRLFLQIVGLLSLFIGGIGIINTMQVLLRRRTLEIATLKTTGYRQGDLAMLFGTEALLLGTMGGIIGTGAGVGVSYLVRAVVEQAFFLHLPVRLDSWIIVSGVLIGIATAGIFGVLPIVQASQLRPIVVLRENEHSQSIRSHSWQATAGLLFLLSLLFVLLATTILGSLPLALIAVYGGAGIIIALSAGFGFLVVAISRLPVYETPDRRMLRWLLAAFAIAVGTAVMSTLLFGASYLLARSGLSTSTLSVGAYLLIILVLIGIVTLGGGIVFLLVTMISTAVMFAPRSWRTTLKFAYRNIGSQRVRTTTILTLLFVGVFAIGLVLNLGQSFQGSVNQFADVQPYNLFLAQPPRLTSPLLSDLTTRSGVDTSQTIVNPAAQVRLLSIKGQPVERVFAGIADKTYGNGTTTVGTQGIQTLLRAVKGYALGSGKRQDIPAVAAIQSGRNLNASDAGTNHVLVGANLQFPPLSLRIGDSFIVQSVDTVVTQTLTIKGFYSVNPLKDFPLIGLILTDEPIARALGRSLTTDYLSLRVEPKYLPALKEHLAQAQPTVQQISIVDAVAVVSQIFSLALIAGLIIIANAVALAMLERRREIGILKSVGYTSRSILATVLVENGLIGLLSSLVAMFLVSGAMVTLRVVVLKTDVGFAPGLALIVILGTVLLTMFIAASVAWNATRVRPLVVLRYE